LWSSLCIFIKSEAYAANTAPYAMDKAQRT
jgi:hypothetical protein